MIRYRIASFVCRLLPPVLAQTVRNILFPISLADSREFTKNAVTGSKFNGVLSDYHSYRFAIHGYFDWRNIIIAHTICKEQPGDIIEIGANVGTETISYSDIVANNGKVHAFEPLPINIQALENLYPIYDNILIYKKAISNTSGFATFQIPNKNDSGTGKLLMPKNQVSNTETLQVDTIPLDVFSSKLEKISFISIDTEGHEPYVLEGARETICKNKPAIVLEVSPKLLNKFSDQSSADILKFFSNINYECYIIGFSSLKKIENIKLTEKSTANWLCVHISNISLIKKVGWNLKIRTYFPWFILRPLSIAKNE